MPALGLVPLRLAERGVWNPDKEYWGEEGEPIEEWAKPIIARGPRPAFEMEQVLPGEDPDDPFEDPILQSNGRKGLAAAEGKPMGKNRGKTNRKMQAWIDARERHRLSHAQVQMARELGMNPEKLGKLDHHSQEPWKMPLRRYIEHLYLKTFGRPSPDSVLSIEDRLLLDRRKKDARHEAKRRFAAKTP